MINDPKPWQLNPKPRMIHVKVGKIEHGSFGNAQGLQNWLNKMMATVPEAFRDAVNADLWEGVVSLDYNRPETPEEADSRVEAAQKQAADAKEWRRQEHARLSAEFNPEWADFIQPGEGPK